MKKFAVSICLVLAVFGVCFAQGFIKPVSGMPEYNGTYKGKPNSGSARYTTLYRDNQDDGARSGCRGEGCGRHPGVDIAVSSGTNVVAPIGGTVVISRCDSSWGGLVVIKSPHPIRPWENILQVFGHLKKRAYSNGASVGVGDYIASGTVFAKSGGASTDSCRGNSTGAHLHYQIDKDDSNDEPWFPTASTLHSRDDSFVVSSKTYNPIVFLQGGYRWLFEENGNRELWDLFNFQSWGVSGGALWFDGALDPYIRRSGTTNCGLSKPCSGSFAVEATEFKNIYLDTFSQCYSTLGKVYFVTKDDSVWDERKVLYYFPPGVGVFRATLDASVNSKWAGIITGLRVDHAENCSAFNSDPVYFGEVSMLR